MTRAAMAAMGAAIVGIALVVGLGAAAVGDKPAADSLLDKALEAIASQQKAVKNLTAAGVLNEESLDPQTGKWKPQEERDAAATYDGPDATRCQIACRLSKTPMPDAPRSSILKDMS